MGKVLGIVYRIIASYLLKKAGYRTTQAQTGAVTLIQRFGSALNLNIHFHMLFLDGVYAQDRHGIRRFFHVKAPSHSELVALAHQLSHRVGRYLERQGLLSRDMENAYLALDFDESNPMPHLQSSSIQYRIAVGSQQGRKAFQLQTVAAANAENASSSASSVAKVSGFSLHAGVCAQANERKKLEQLCRYITRPAISEKRLSLTGQGHVRIQLKTASARNWKTKESRCRVTCNESSTTFSAVGFWNMVFCGCAATIAISNAWSPLVGRSCASLRPRHS